MVAVTEQQRRLLHQGLVETLGEEVAGILMEHLPPVGWGDVARRSDVDAAALVTRTELRAETSQLRAEIASLGGELRAEIASLGGELRAEIASLGGELRAEMGAQTRTFVTAMVIAVVSMFLGVAGLFVGSQFSG